MTEPGRHRGLPPSAPARTNELAGRPVGAPGRLSGPGGGASATVGGPDADGSSTEVTGSQAQGRIPDSSVSSQPGARASAADLLPSVTLPKGGGAIRKYEPFFSAT